MPAHADPEERHVGHLRRLRHPDRLGDRHLRGVRARRPRKDGVEIDRDELIALFHEVSRGIEAGSYELYAEVLRRTVVKVAKRLGLADGTRARALPARIDPALAAVPRNQRAAARSSPRSTSWA